MNEVKTNETIVAAPVAEVTVMEDRARVVRRGRAFLTDGTVRVAVEDVAHVIGDKTLAARITGPDPAAKVADARVRRVWVTPPAPRPDLPPDIHEQINRLTVQRDDLQERIDFLNVQLELQQTLVLANMDEFAFETTKGRSDPDRWERELKTQREREAELRRNLMERTLEREALDRKISELENRRQAADTPPARRFAARIEAELAVPRAGEWELTFEYTVPNACWRPCHTAKLDGGTLRFESEGCVWQNTGEDWSGVDLMFSTQRLSLGTEPPELEEDRLAAQKRPEKIEVEAREQEIQTAGLGEGGEAPARKRQMLGIDDGGQALHLRATGKATVRSDGRPCRVGLFRIEAEAQAERVAIPELAENVLIKSVQTNPGPHPILAGPVDLVLGSGYAGRTSLKFVAPGEKFPIGWGPDPELRVKYERETKEGERKALSSTITNEHLRRCFLSNLGAEEKSVRVTQRVPVSELEQVKIAVDAKRTREGKQPDANGFVEWAVKLPPRGRAQVDLTYTIAKPKDMAGV